MSFSKNFLIILSVFIASGAAAQERADTLMVASKAKSIDVRASSESVVLTLNNIDGSADNFYFKASAPDGSRYQYWNHLSVNKISDITVVERPDTLTVSFRTDAAEPRSYSYLLPDSANRSTSVWTGPKGSDFGLSIARKGRTVVELVSQGLSFGWVGALGAPAGVNPSMKRSHEYNWNMIAGFKVSRNFNSFSMGLGIRFRDIQTTPDRYFHKTDDGRIVMMPYEEHSRNRVSRIDLFNLQVPVTYTLAFGPGRHCNLMAGPILCFNTGASIKTKYTIDDRDYSIKTRHISPVPVSVDFMLALGYDGLGMYVRYSPVNVLRSRAAVDMQTISTGFIFDF